MTIEHQTLSEAVDAALRPLRARYWQDVRAFAEEIVESHSEHDSGDMPRDCDDCIGSVEETADGSEWVIYTRNAYLVPLLSDNSNAGEEQMGADLWESNADTTLSRIAYFAMAADLLSSLPYAR